MEPIPMYARVLGIVLAAIAAPLLVASVFAGTLRAVQINAEIHRTTSYSAGTTPKLHVEAQFGNVVIERGEPGRIDVIDDHGTASITRAAAGSLAAQINVTVSQHADEFEVRRFSPIFQPAQLNRYSTLTLRVPAHTDLEVSCLGMAFHSRSGCCASALGCRSRPQSHRQHPRDNVVRRHQVLGPLTAGSMNAWQRNP